MSRRRDVANRVGYVMPFCGVTGAMERMRDEEGVEQEMGENNEMAPEEQDAWCKSMQGLVQGALYKKLLRR